MGDEKQAKMDQSAQASLEQSFGKTKEIMQAVQVLHKQQEEADKKASKEMRSHAQTKEKIKSVEVENLRARELMEFEIKEHATDKDKLDRAERDHMKTRDSLQAQRHEVSSMLLQMEALKVEMEAQRKAFVVNVNWAARCTELKVKFDTSRSDYDKLYDQHASTKAALTVAEKAREEFRNKSIPLLEALAETQAEVARQTEALSGQPAVSEEVQKKLEAWQKLKEAQAAEQLSSGKGKSKALAVLERQLAQGDAGLLSSSFTGWVEAAKSEIKQRKYKDQAMKRAMKTIASEGMGLLANCLTPWRKEMEKQKKHAMELANRKLEEANSRSGGGAAVARQRALAQLEKQFIGQDKALIKQAFGAWAGGAAIRKKKEGNMSKGARMIANSGKALQAEVFMMWNIEADKTRKKKKDKEASNHKAARMIAGSGKALQADIFNVWMGWVKNEAEERKKKAAGNTKAARMMANSAGTLMNIVFDSWMKLQIERRKKDAGNKKCARMISGNNDVLVREVFKGWGEVCGTKKAKEQNTAKAVRMINASGEALQASCFKSWSDDIRKNREKNKKLRAVEKTIGAGAEGMKLLVTTAWRNTAVMESRKKKSKQRSMGSAMKSITGGQDLLMTQMLMSWARIIAAGNVEKLQAKVTAAQAALDDAMVAATRAVEEDVGRCMAEADRLKVELETAKKQLADALAKAEAIEGQIEESNTIVKNREIQLNSLASELDDSRRKARDIGDELAKVGVFLQSAGPRRPSRPRSGAKGAKDDSSLPRIGSAGRPMSGRKGPSSGKAWEE